MTLILLYDFYAGSMKQKEASYQRLLFYTHIQFTIIYLL
jgi:hypothetical protein